MGNKTKSLNPRHTYVPWITVNDEHDTKAENLIKDNALAYVCEQYKGPNKSKDCPSVREQRVHRVKKFFSDAFDYYFGDAKTADKCYK